LKNREFQYQWGAVIRGDQTEKKLALVFTGDLYAEGGHSIIALLEQYHIRASFFLTGNFYRNSSFEHLITSLIAGGHYLGAHSDQHLLYCDWNNRDSLLVTQEQFELDLEKNYREMARFGIAKEEVRFFLPPYEWYNDTISSWTGNLGLHLINYTPGTLSHADYTDPGNPGYRSSEEILSSVLKEEQLSPHGLNGFMLLMHVGSDEARKDKFYPSLKILIETLLSKGYRFVTVDELLAPASGRYVAGSSPGKGWARNSVNAAVFRKNSVVTHGRIQYLSYYDSTGTVMLAKRRLGTEQWTVQATPYHGEVTDAHRTISIMTDGTGILHVAWDHHNSPLRYCRTTGPDTLALTPPMAMVGYGEDEVTYPEFHHLSDGRLIFLYRDGSSGNGNLVINRYDPLSGKWERLHEVLIDGEGERNAYWQACSDSQGRLHLSWVWRESWDVATNHDLCYAVSPDAGESWFTSDGKPYSLPITARSAEYAARIAQRRELINQTSMAADNQGYPYIATYFTPTGSDVPQYHLIFRDAEGWKISQITQRTIPFTLSGGGTRKIPVSRPQVVIRRQGNGTQALLVFRDAETGSGITLGCGEPDDPEQWEFRQLLPTSVESWEPTYDTELWRTQGLLHLFLQKAGQGEGEQLEELSPQDVSILEVPLPSAVNRSPSGCGN